MLKVLLVDDEPFIIQGLKVIIDWENEEFEIAGMVSNGKEALQFLENENVDLVIADIRMPEMTGLELLETLRKDKKSDVYFVILSGYADFSYAQQAMQNDCTDYILKPVDKEMLLKVLNKVLVLKNEKNQINEDNKKMKQAYLARHLISPIQGKYDEVKISADGIVLCKDSLDKLLRTVEQNNHLEIRNAVAKFYDEMSSMGMNGESMNLNINYLLFQFIHLASEQDDNVNQQEILRLISESSFKTGIERGSRAHMTRFCCEYGDYLSQLRKNVSRGVIGMVEKEVRDNYATNITLKSLSEKYYVNSAYLGQLFRKKYGQSFKDYLNNYRMERAAELLLRTDKKIIQIAEEVGYHDMDYFVNRFIQVKGCTPARFRRQMQSGE